MRRRWIRILRGSWAKRRGKSASSKRPTISKCRRWSGVISTRCESMIGRPRRTSPIASTNWGIMGTNEIAPSLQGPVWQPIGETIGVYDQFHDIDNRWLHRFGSNVISSIPKGSVYFGGTDPGRYIISALSESQTEGVPFFTLTQNQLVDSRYAQYIRLIYGSKLTLPTDED